SRIRTPGQWGLDCPGGGSRVKTIPIQLLAHKQQGTTSLGYLLWIRRRDGEVFGFTSSGEDVEIDGVLYEGSQGLDASSLVTSAGLTVDNMELTTLHDGSVFVTGDIISGAWIES